MTEGKWVHQVPLLTFLVFIFSLRDYKVIWPYSVDEDVVTPIKKNKNTGQVLDFLSKPLGVYADAVDTLNTLFLQKYRMAAVSSSPDVETNTKLLLFFNLYNYFPIQEIFGGDMREHLEVIHRSTLIPFEDTFYFDTKNDELDGLKKMGVNVVEVEDGLDISYFKEALNIYSKKKESTSLNSTTPAP